MNRDLEDTLAELGGGYRALVDTMRAAPEVEPSRSEPLFPLRRCGRVWLTAAAVSFLLLGACVLLIDREVEAPSAAIAVYTAAYTASEQVMETIVASQRPDGSWSNDFLTRQNAAALRRSDDTRMRIAYRRAVRYLRSKGLAPLTDSELEERRRFAAARS